MPEINGRLGLGKLPFNFLSQVLDTIRPIIAPETVQGPGIGEDAAIVRLPCCDLAFHTDPITEAGSRIGWLSLHVSANDVATSGACPRWASIAVLMPPAASVNDVNDVVNGISIAARELGIDIAGGHTEVSPGISKPIVVSTVIGITCRGCAIRTGDAAPGDSMVMIGYAGAEGTAILATDFIHIVSKCGLSDSDLREAASLARSISIVPVACRLNRMGVAKAMHDVTEGGVIGGLVEIALASRARIVVDLDRVPVHPITFRISQCLGIDPMKLIGSGGLLVAVRPGYEEMVVSLARELGYPASVIGRVEQGRPALIVNSGEQTEYYEPPADEISRVWARYVSEKTEK